MIYFCLGGDGAMYNLGQHDNWESAEMQAESDLLDPVWTFNQDQAGEWSTFFNRIIKENA